MTHKESFMTPARRNSFHFPFVILDSSFVIVPFTAIDNDL